MAGVIPPIFASSIILLAGNDGANWFSAGESMRWLKDISSTLDSWSAGVCDVLCRRDHLLLFLSTRHWFSTVVKLRTI
jgi:preprotein translocase subunit SecY